MENFTNEYANYSNTTANIDYQYITIKWQINFYIIGYSISALLSILFNCANILTVPRVKNCFGDNTKLCLMCLAVVDLFTGLICSTSGVLFPLVTVPTFVYDTIVILCTASVWQSMLILTLASGDRYVAVTRPLRYITIASRKRMIGALTAVITVPILLSTGSYLQSVLTGVCNPFTSICPSLIKPSHIIYNILPFSAVVITTFINARLVCISRRHARQIAAQEAAVNAGNIVLPLPSAAGMKGLKTILVVTGVFYLAWLPSTIITFLNPIPSINVPLVLTIFVRYAITSNSWWNACVYCIMNKSYRNVLLKMLRNCFGACTRPSDDDHENVPVYQLPYIPPV